MAFWGSRRDDFVNRRRSPSRDQLLLVTARVNGARQEKMRKAGAVTVLAIGLGVGCWAAAMGSSALAAWLFAQNARFTLRHLDLHSTGRLSSAHLQHYAGLHEGQNLFAVSMAAVRLKLETVPLIARAEIERKLPDTLIVNVQERIAVARISQPGQPVLPVDRDGHLMSPPASPHLPLILGIAERGLAPGGVIQQTTARDALALLDIHENAHLAALTPIVSVDVSDPAQLLLTLQDEAKIPMARDHLDRRLTRLAKMIQTGRDEGRGDLLWADFTVDRNEPAKFSLDHGTNDPAATPHLAQPPAAHANQRLKVPHG